MIETVFIDATNCDQYRAAVQTWLQDDFKQKNRPKEHAWHDIDVIYDSFARHQAMVTLVNKTLIAYMTWDMINKVKAEIVHVAVKPEWQRRGIFSRLMLPTFLANFPKIMALLVCSTDSTKEIYYRLGWWPRPGSDYFDKNITDNDRKISFSLGASSRADAVSAATSVNTSTAAFFFFDSDRHPANKRKQTADSEAEQILAAAILSSATGQAPSAFKVFQRPQQRAWLAADEKQSKEQQIILSKSHAHK